MVREVRFHPPALSRRAASDRSDSEEFDSQCDDDLPASCRRFWRHLAEADWLDEHEY